MKTKNFTPMPLGTRVTARQPRQPEMTVIVRGKFRVVQGGPLELIDDPENPLVQGFMSADLFAEEDDERLGESLQPGDFADFKPHAEALFKGSCHAPGGVELSEARVRMSVGSWSKSLSVVGRRVFSDSRSGAALSKPLPFTEMPITWANAFGGPGHADNPVGKGINSSEAPTIEPLGASHGSRGSRVESVGFGPINPQWELRKRKRGKNYGAAWKRERAPFYADDFDWTHFQSALPDQWFPYLRGDEPLSFFNLHREHALLETRLPGLIVRAFLRDDQDNVREVKLNLDTVFADLEDDAVYLTWRGLCLVREEDLKDVKTLLVASEALDAPQPAAHYRALLEAFEADPLGIEEARKKLLPEMPDGRDRMAEFKAFQAVQQEAANSNDPDGLAKTVDAALKLVGGPEAEKQRALLAENFATIKQKTAENKVADPTAGFSASLNKPTPKVDLASVKPGQAPAIGDKESANAIKELKAKLPEIEQKMKEANLPTEVLDRMRESLEHPMLAGLGKEPEPGTAPAPGADLSGMDLRRRDLRGADLSGCLMVGTMLSDANLEGARLVGATLSNALLNNANLRGADLSEAKLTTSILSGVDAAGCNLRGAVIDRCTLDGANLRLADLKAAKCNMVLFMSADLSGATANGASFFKCMWNEGKLEDAVFDGCEIEQSMVRCCSAMRASFVAAKLRTAAFFESDLSNATFERASGEVGIFQGSKMVEVSFRDADLFRSHFTEADLSRAVFVSADLRGSRFYRASLVRADFDSANLLRADFSRANLERTRFVKANLYDAKFLQAFGSKAEFLDANLKRAILERS